MSVAHDIFSETNPAYFAHAAVTFVNAYTSMKDAGPELPLVYLALPIAASGDFSVTFDGTNKKTGLMEWLERSPRVQVELAARLNGTMDAVTDSIRFACFAELLELTQNARLKIGRKTIKKSAVQKLSAEPKKVIKHAERLGYWFADVGSTRATFDVLGLST